MFLVILCVCVCFQAIKVYGEDSHSRSVWVSPGATAREACHMLVQTAHCSDQENWALLEVHPTLGLGKTTRWTNLLTAVCRNFSYLILSPQRGVWRTTRLCWRFRRPGLWRVTRGLCSARTTPSTSSSGSQWYAASRLFKTMWQCKSKERSLRWITLFPSCITADSEQRYFQRLY